MTAARAAEEWPSKLKNRVARQSRAHEIDDLSEGTSEGTKDAPKEAPKDAFETKRFFIAIPFYRKVETSKVVYQRSCRIQFKKWAKKSGESALSAIAVTSNFEISQTEV